MKYGLLKVPFFCSFKKVEPFLFKLKYQNMEEGETQTGFGELILILLLTGYGKIIIISRRKD